MKKRIKFLMGLMFGLMCLSVEAPRRRYKGSESIEAESDSDDDMPRRMEPVASPALDSTRQEAILKALFKGGDLSPYDLDFRFVLLFGRDVSRNDAEKKAFAATKKIVDEERREFLNDLEGAYKLFYVAPVLARCHLHFIFKKVTELVEDLALLCGATARNASCVQRFAQGVASELSGVVAKPSDKAKPFKDSFTVLSFAAWGSAAIQSALSNPEFVYLKPVQKRMHNVLKRYNRLAQALRRAWARLEKDQLDAALESSQRDADRQRAVEEAVSKARYDEELRAEKELEAGECSLMAEEDFDETGALEPHEVAAVSSPLVCRK